MLLKTTSNGQKGIYKYKSVFWEQQRKQTPNEAYDTDPTYRASVNAFAKYHDIPGPHKFVEIRVVSNKPSVIFSKHENWWDSSSVMDHVFWVFSKPVRGFKDGRTITDYIIEPMENLRLLEIAFKKFGIKVDDPWIHCFALPTECAVLAWTETANGYSEHIHHREEKVLTPLEQEVLAAREEAKKEIEKGLISIEDIKGFPGGH